MKYEEKTKVVAEVIRETLETQPRISSRTIARLFQRKIGITIKGPEIREHIHIIRLEGTIPMLIADGKGYRYPESRKDFWDYVQGGLQERIDLQQKVKDALLEQFFLSDKLI